MEREEAKVQAEQVTGVSNVAYDLMVVLSNHLEGMAAIQEYKLDADAANDSEVKEALERVEARQRQGVDELRALLVKRL